MNVRVAAYAGKLGKIICMHMLLYIVGGFMMVLGLSSLVVQDPGKGLAFLVVLLLAIGVTAIVVRADDRAPPTPGDE